MAHVCSVQAYNIHARFEEIFYKRYRTILIRERGNYFGFPKRG